MIGSGKKLPEITANLGYSFQNLALLELALTHSSVNGIKNNQRLEFLGDAILNFVIAEYLYQHNGEAFEGELTRIRSFLVKEETLCLIAKKLEMSQIINLGAGELKTGGLNKSSILADTIEALIAAIYLDSDLTTVKHVIIDWYQRLNYFNVDHTINEIHKDLLPGNKDPKTMLQEWLHAKGLNLPVYEVISITGQPHQQKFQVACMIESMAITTYGIGTTRKKAEQAAAQKVLELLL